MLSEKLLNKIKQNTTTVEENEIKGRNLFIDNFVKKQLPDYKIIDTEINDRNDLFLVNDDNILIVEVKYRNENYINGTMLLEEKKYNGLLNIKNQISEVCNKTVKILYSFVFDNNIVKISNLNDNINNYKWTDQQHQKTQCFSQEKINKKVTFLTDFKYF